MKLTIKKHDNVQVVRDDLFPWGSKARFLDDYIAALPEKELVYGSSPRWGYAQISLAYLAKKHGKTLTLFLAKSDEVHPYTRRALDLGATVIQVPVGFLKVCEAKARNHAKQAGGRLLPCGLDVPEAITAIAKIARRCPVTPDEVYTVASSGTLTRGLQAAWPDAAFFAVRVGKSLSPEAVGRATIIDSGQPFNRPAKDLPPFPSVPEYDAKAWRFIPKDGRKIRLFWNVGA